MHPAFVTMLGVSGQNGQTGQPLVSAGALRSPLGLLRAQVSTSVVALGADGVTWLDYAADVPRFTGTAQRLLIGGQRTNSVRNPRAEGVVIGTIGSGGALPTNWNFLGGQAGLTVAVLAAGTVNGVSTVTLRFSGTATGTSVQLCFETTTQVAATPSSTWSGSVFHRLDAAPAAPNSHRMQVLNRTAAGAAVTGSPGALTFTPNATLQRATLAGTLSSDGTVARVIHQYNTALTSGAAYDWTITLGWPQLEQGAFASTPVLPSVGTPAASTRGADLVTATLAGLGIGAGGACTILWSGLLPQNASSGLAQTIFMVDDGTANNRFAVLNAAGGASITGERALAGATGSATLGTHTAGTPFRLGMALDGTGRAAFSLNGAAVSVVTGGPAAGLATLRLGSSAAGTQSMFGETGLLRALPYAMSDAALPAAVSGLPG